MLNLKTLNFIIFIAEEITIKETEMLIQIFVNSILQQNVHRA